MLALSDHCKRDRDIRARCNRVSLYEVHSESKFPYFLNHFMLTFFVYFSFFPRHTNIVTPHSKFRQNRSAAAVTTAHQRHISQR